MSGGLAVLVHAKMAVAGEVGLLLRVEPQRTEELLGEPHTSSCVMRNREMPGWLRVEAPGVATDEELERWAGVGAGYARTLPPR